MIKSSFIILDKIGKKKEQSIWAQGVKSWEAFTSANNVRGISQRVKQYYDRKLIEAEKELYRQNSEHFTKLLPSSETWRLYEYFKEDAVFLDIETDGMGKYSDITVVGIYDGIETRTMVRGINLDMNILRKELEKHKLIVTFNGLCFDIPFIEKRYRNVIPKIPHMDLRFCCARLGMNYGLKQVEKKLGISRRHQELSGADALTLWDLYKRTGNKDYLQELVEYNEEDIINLKAIANHASNELKKICNAQLQ